MAVQTYYSRAKKDPAAVFTANPANCEGNARELVSGPVLITNGDSATTKIYLGKLASNWIVKPTATLYHEAVAGVTSLDIGFEKDGSSTINAVDQHAFLAAALDISSAGTKSVVAAVATAKLGQFVWEWLGYTRDPGLEFDVVAIMNQAATATKSIISFIPYVRK